jgi:hypothetical protein
MLRTRTKKTTLGYRCGRPEPKPVSDGERQAPMRARKASKEKTVRTPFQKFHHLATSFRTVSLGSS